MSHSIHYNETKFYTVPTSSCIVTKGDDMKTRLFLNNEKFIAGITVKDDTAFEQNNMALHVCHNTDQIIENRAQLAATLGCSINDFVCANQTHSANFYKVTASEKGRGATNHATAIPNTDAMYTFEHNIVLSSFTADCVPITITNEASGLIAVVHSGWQGTVKEITLKLLQHLVNEENCPLEHFNIHIGTALSQEKFEVDEDVYMKFKQLRYADEFMYYNSETRKYHIDNQLTVKKQCELVGVPCNQITIDTTCTFKSTDGFSYREDRQTGRHLTFIMQK